MEDKKCKWRELDHLDMCGNYETDCGHIFTLNDGTPEDNEIKYCPFCGKKIFIIQYN